MTPLGIGPVTFRLVGKYIRIQIDIAEVCSSLLSCFIAIMRNAMLP